MFARVNTDLIMWVLIEEDGSYDKGAVHHYVEVLANAIQVQYQLEAFNKAGYGVMTGGEE